ncbi:MAG: hypothetical protein ACXWT4_16565 [Methylobacter sp.]
MKKNDVKEPIHIPEDHKQVIYADRIIGFAPGPCVSKLTLGMDVKQNNAPIATLVLPTSSLIESLTFIMKSLNENESLKEELLKNLDIIKTQYSQL